MRLQPLVGLVSGMNGGQTTVCPYEETWLHSVGLAGGQCPPYDYSLTLPTSLILPISLTPPPHHLSMLPNPFLGVWQRHSIQFDQGPIDTSQSVLWIQAETHFADVRSAPFVGRLTPERYRAMDWRSRFDADLLGFAGTFTWAEQPPTCTWHHRLALTPRQRPDTSRYQWLDADNFLEQGTCDDNEGKGRGFVEHWHRIHPGPVQVWRLARAEHQGQALRAGGWAVSVHQWRDSPTADPLGDGEIFGAFSATAWQHWEGTWRSPFGTEASLGTPPQWTPLDLDDPAGAWQFEESAPSTLSQSLTKY